MEDTGPVTQRVGAKIRRLNGHIDGDISEMSEGQIEALRREHEVYTKCREAIKTLADATNAYSSDSLVHHAIIDEMQHTHRVLQQYFIIEALSALGDYGKMSQEHPERVSDPRNDYAMKLCRMVRECFADELFWRDR